MPRIANFPPLRPKRPANEAIPEPLRMPHRSLSPANYAPEPVAPSPTVFKAEPMEHSPTQPMEHSSTQLIERPPPQPMEHSPTQPMHAISPNASSGEPMDIEQTSTLEAVLLEQPQHLAQHSGGGCAAMPQWPSELHNQRDTMWLLPPCSDQASALALILRTEIQSHNITRETLHMTEQRRLESVLKCNQLCTDVQGWSVAYNNLTTALRQCSEEISRLSAENVALKAGMQASRVGTLCSQYEHLTNIS
jgi:hypothetical protein